MKATWGFSFRQRPARLLPALACAGLTSTVAQLVLLRELLATLYGNELVIGLILAVWLGCVAAGAWAMPRLFPRAAGGTLAVNQALLALALALQVLWVRGGRLLWRASPGALVPLLPMLLIVVVALAPLCLLVGWQFAIGARMLAERGGSAGQAYVAERYVHTTNTIWLL